MLILDGKVCRKHGVLKWANPFGDKAKSNGSHSCHWPGEARSSRAHSQKRVLAVPCLGGYGQTAILFYTALNQRGRIRKGGGRIVSECPVQELCQSPVHCSSSSVSLEFALMWGRRRGMKTKLWDKTEEGRWCYGVWRAPGLPLPPQHHCLVIPTLKIQLRSLSNPAMRILFLVLYLKLFLGH